MLSIPSKYNPITPIKYSVTQKITPPKIYQIQAPQPSQCKKYFIDLLVITPYIAVYYIIYSY